MRTLFAPVTVYSRRGCKPCERVKQKLEDADIEYDSVSLDLNEEARTYVVDVLGAKSVPVIVSDVRDPIIGYQPDELDELIRLLKLEKIHDYVYEGDDE